MRLSKNFVLSEITRSNTAKRLNISNEPTKEHLHNMQMLIGDLIQPMRDDIGPVRISSGYRSKELNRAIGGSSKSQHCKGEALDLQFWFEGKMNNNQMINEFDFAWIHISLKSKGNRKQVLEAYHDEDGDTKYRYADIKPSI